MRDTGVQFMIIQRYLPKKHGSKELCSGHFWNFLEENICLLYVFWKNYSQNPGEDCNFKTAVF